MNHSQPVAPATYPSVLEPVSRALRWTGFVLFRPFDVSKWLVLGFCGWLAWLGEKGGGSFNWNTSRDDAVSHFRRAEDWALDNLALVIFLVVALVLAALLLWVLFLWLSSRGKFMFLDGVVHDRGAVVEPWHRFRDAGNSLFGFRIVVALIGLLSFGILLALMVATLAGFGFEFEEPGPVLFLVIFGWVAILAAVLFAFILVAMSVTDFIVPIMWVRGCRVMEAWSEFLSILAANLGTFLLYVLLKIVLSLTIALIACAATCATCCIAALPYIGTVILLPLYVFHRSYSMYFFGQFSAGFAALTPTPPPPATSTAPPAPPAPVTPSGGNPNTFDQNHE